MTILLAGSAGEGVQSGADAFVMAAMSCGLESTKKGNYPVTVGTGFSAAEIILSPDPIEFTGIRGIDWAVASSDDGISYLARKLDSLAGGEILADSGIAVPGNDARLRTADFRGAVSRKDANLLMLSLDPARDLRDPSARGLYRGYPCHEARGEDQSRRPGRSRCRDSATVDGLLFFSRVARGTRCGR